MDIRFEKGILRENALLLCEWSNEQGKAFQEQWMGPLISYPLDCGKVTGLENLFSIFHRERFIGVIQKVRADGDSVHVGRFVLDPRKTGEGLGTAALKRFTDLLFEDENVQSITLTVFDSNRRAKRLYEKLGFVIDEIVETPKLKYVMRKTR